MKAKMPCVARPKVMVTGMKAWEWRLLWTYWEKSQKRKIVNKVLDKKWDEKETAWGKEGGREL